MEENKKNVNSEQENTHSEQIEKPLNLDEIFADDPEGYAAKFTPEGRKIVINYLNTRPLAQVEAFFASMFDIEDKDPFYNIKWVKRVFDYLKDVCPRGESKDVLISLAANTVLFKKTKKDTDKKETTGEKEDVK